MMSTSDEQVVLVCADWWCSSIRRTRPTRTQSSWSKWRCASCSNTTSTRPTLQSSRALHSALSRCAYIYSSIARSLAHFFGVDSLCALASHVRSQGRDTQVGRDRIRQLLDAVDSYLPVPARENDKPVYLPIEGVHNITGCAHFFDVRPVGRSSVLFGSDVRCAAFVQTRYSGDRSPRARLPETRRRHRNQRLRQSYQEFRLQCAPFCSPDTRWPTNTLNFLVL